MKRFFNKIFVGVIIIVVATLILRHGFGVGKENNNKGTFPSGEARPGIILKVGGDVNNNGEISAGQGSVINIEAGGSYNSETGMINQDQ